MIEMTLNVNSIRVDTICQIVIAICAVIGCVRRKRHRRNRKE